MVCAGEAKEDVAASDAVKRPRVVSVGRRYDMDDRRTIDGPATRANTVGIPTMVVPGGRRTSARSQNRQTRGSPNACQQRASRRPHVVGSSPVSALRHLALFLRGEEHWHSMDRGSAPSFACSVSSQRSHRKRGSWSLLGCARVTMAASQAAAWGLR